MTGISLSIEQPRPLPSHSGGVEPRPESERARGSAAVVGGERAHPPSAFMSGRELTGLQARNRRLITAACPYLALLSRAVSQERHAVILCDAEGTILESLGNEPLVTGASFAGGDAHALGCALAEGRILDLVAPDHFLETLRSSICQGMPIRGADGTVCGVLAITLRAPLASERVHPLLRCAVRAIEAELLRAELEEGAARPGGQVVSIDPRDRQVRRRLREEVRVGGKQLRLRLDAAALMIDEGRLSQARELLVLAEDCLARVERRVLLGRALALEPLPFQAAARPVPLIRGLLELLAEEARPAGVTLVEGRMDDLPVLATSQQVARAALQGLGRALEASDRSGTIRVEVRRLSGASVGMVFLTVPPLGGQRRAFTVGETYALTTRAAGAPPAGTGPA